jgi:hypothetical protein
MLVHEEVTRAGMKHQHIYQRDDHTCQYCGNGASSVDHLTPKALGGTDRWENLVCSCGTCNRLKGDGFYPHLIESMRDLILQRRTSDLYYPPLFWQVQTLELSHEPLEVNPDRGRWFDRTTLRLLFGEPGELRLRARRRKTTAVRRLAAGVPAFDAHDAAVELEYLCLEGYVKATPEYYLNQSQAWLER